MASLSALFVCIHTLFDTWLFAFVTNHLPLPVLCQVLHPPKHWWSCSSVYYLLRSFLMSLGNIFAFAVFNVFRITDLVGCFLNHVCGTFSGEYWVFRCGEVQSLGANSGGYRVAAICPWIFLSPIFASNVIFWYSDPKCFFLPCLCISSLSLHLFSPSLHLNIAKGHNGPRGWVN